MPRLPDIKTSAIDGDDTKQQLESVVRQVNDWGRLISNAEVSNIFKVVKVLDIHARRSENTYEQTTSVEHGLGFIPAYLAYLYNGGTYWLLPRTYLNLASGVVDLHISVGVDDTNVNITIAAPISGTDYPSSNNTPIRVFLLQELGTGA